MLKGLYRAYSFLVYFVRARLQRKSRSRFIQRFVTEVLKTDQVIDLSDIEAYRKRLQADTSEYEKKDMGSGSSGRVSTHKVAANSSVSDKYGRLLARIAQFQQLENALELGSCLGVSSLYLTHQNTQGKLTSLEGCEGTFDKRAENMALELPPERIANIEFIHSNFDSYLQDYIGRFDTVFIDGNHTEKATLSYFERFWWGLPYDGLLIFDDIHWSPGMNKAWKRIKNRPDMVTIDLYQFGLCFKRKSRRGDYTFFY